MAKVKFSFHEVSAPGFKERKKLKAFLETVFKTEKKQLESLHYVFCNDEYLLHMNQSFLKHDTYTDIITFELSSGSKTEGEVYISIDRVLENAQIHQTGFQKELLRVILHGVLHLCGYGDKKPADKQLMRKKEEFYMRKYERE